MASLIGRGRPLASQTQEVVFNVFKYFEKLHSSKSIKELKEIVVEATGVSPSCVARILLRSKENSCFQSSEPKEKRIKKKPITDIQDYEKYDIRQFIYNFHKTENSRVTLKSLLAKLKADLDFKGEVSSLRIIVRDLGFRWKKTKNNRPLLIEKSDIRNLRINFLHKIQQYRLEEKSIVYLDESYVHSGHTKAHSWSDSSTSGLFTNISKGPRLIMIHAGGEMGFLPNCLTIFKSGTTSGDYHHEMNATNYEKWLVERLIPNLPNASVVVIDNAPYHSVQEDKAPNSNSKKQEMLNWLVSKNICCSPNLLKPQLYNLIKPERNRYKSYKFDNLLTSHGHTVVRLPPYHPELNPIELIWAKVKGNVAKRNVTFKLEDVRKITEEEFSHVTVEAWQNCCEHVKKIEKQYIEHEHFVDVQTEEVIINLGEDSETDSDFYQSESESDCP